MSRRQKDLFPDLPDGKKYVSDIPELMAEWHPTKKYPSVAQKLYAELRPKGLVALLARA